MNQFKHITEWKLLNGSHEFPGSDGGTCINEAAVVAAGMEYKKISSFNDFPPCFSRIIGAYAMFLNDIFDDVDRELLLPFVTQLSGTIENSHYIYGKRLNFIISALAHLFGYNPYLVHDLRSFQRRPHNLWNLRSLIQQGYSRCPPSIPRSMVGILQEAIFMGPHSTDQDIDLVNERLNAIKKKALLKEKEAA